MTFWKLHVQVKANFVFHLFNVSLSFWTQSLKQVRLQFIIHVFNFTEKLQNIFKIGF